MAKNQNTLACYLDKKTRTTQDVHFSAPSQLPKVTQTQATTTLELVAAFSEGEVHLTLYVKLGCTTAVLRKLPSPAALQQLFRSMSETMPTKLLALIMRALKGQTTSLLQK
ncbi:uncharacterized protein LOC142571378 isoform X3 [Dermacentor variabilis]|uniref:uncharacterized protein LOC142571378 isoform X3 n=1 Tax=Dermacentor variabilis TaxID=34621 RepID=UPI003F5AE94B